MAAVLCSISKVAKGAPPLFTRYELAHHMNRIPYGRRGSMAATRSALAYFVRRKWVSRAGVRAHPQASIFMPGTGLFVVTRRGAKASRLACQFLPRLRRRRRR